MRRPWGSIGYREKSEILAFVSPLTLKDFAQLEALHLAGGGARQLFYCAQPFGALVARPYALAGLGRCLQRGAGVAVAGHEQPQALQAVRAAHVHAGPLVDPRFIRHGLLDLRWPTPL